MLPSEEPVILVSGCGAGLSKVSGARRAGRAAGAQGGRAASNK